MSRNQAGFSSERPGAGEGSGRLSGDVVNGWFADPIAVTHYARAASAIGLWRSEQVVLNQVFERAQRILDVGCGAGRIALGLWQLGFGNIAGIDFCPPMIEAAKVLAATRDAAIHFEEGDVTDLKYTDGSFEGAVFGFNGLMQIPGRVLRRRALAELRRVLRPGGHLVFTTHDRDLASESGFWADEKKRWRESRQDSRLVDFGDRVLNRPEGIVFMHLPDRAEILEDLAATGWAHRFDRLRSHLANEPAIVREFSDECRFWVAEA